MSKRAWAAFAAVSTLWGMPYLLIKIAVQDGISPAFVAWARVVLGAAVLVGLAWRAGVFRGLRSRVREAASMELALATSRGPDVLTNIEGRAPW